MYVSPSIIHSLSLNVTFEATFLAFICVYIHSEGTCGMKMGSWEINDDI